MKEIWVSIREFPNYRISNHGNVLNHDTNRLLRESCTSAGVVKVGLVCSGVQYTRSVKVLVAEAFVSGQSDIFNTPVHLDGDQRNNRVDNLVWRPRWFAWKYARQFVNITVHHNRGPIVDVSTKEIYDTFFHAALLNGLLVDDIWRSILNNNTVFPTEQKFVFLVDFKQK